VMQVRPRSLRVATMRALRWDVDVPPDLSGWYVRGDGTNRTTQDLGGRHG
jgi:hypothetical protein